MKKPKILSLLTLTLFLAWASIVSAGNTADETVRISATDTTSGRLQDKLTEGSGINIDNLVTGANETLTLSTQDELSTKGDLLSSDGSGDTTLAVGTNGQVLVVDSAASNGIKWADQTDLSSPGPIGDTTPSTGEFTDLSASDNLILNDLYKVRFVISVKNDGGTIKHRTNRLASHNSAGLSNFPTQVSGLSSTYTATPLLSSSVDFAGGAGLQNSSTAALIFNWVNVQPTFQSDNHIIPVIVYNDTGSYYLAHGVSTNHNVNGTTQERQAIFLYNNSGSQVSFNTTNIPTGKQIIFAVDGWVR